MLIFLWAYVMISAAFPGGQALVHSHAQMIESSMRASTNLVQPRPGVAIGAAAGFAR